MANVNTLRFSVKGSSGYLLKILLKAIVEDIVQFVDNDDYQSWAS